MNADGSGEANLTRTPGLQESSPSWSTTGVIAYHATEVLPYPLVPELREKLGLASILVLSALLAGVALFAWTRGELPFGALAIIFGLNAALMSVLSDEYRFIPGAFVAGIGTDLVVWRLKPGTPRSLQLRVVGSLVPAAYVAAYLITVALGRGIGWSVHLWAGSVLLAGCVGFLLSLTFDGPHPTSAAPPLALRQERREDPPGSRT